MLVFLMLKQLLGSNITFNDTLKSVHSFVIQIFFKRTLALILPRSQTMKHEHFSPIALLVAFKSF